MSLKLETLYHLKENGRNKNVFFFRILSIIRTQKRFINTKEFYLTCLNSLSKKVVKLLILSVFTKRREPSPFKLLKYNTNLLIMYTDCSFVHFLRRSTFHIRFNTR